MPNPALISTFLRELFVARSLSREPEPSLVMDDPNQVAAYVQAGRTDGIMSAGYLFHSARISQAIQGCGNVLDLACGPATQLGQVAQLNPDIQFTGMDLSANMLHDAEKYIQDLDLSNVCLRHGDITRLEGVNDHSFDAVISTMSLHHLPTLQHLNDCFATIRRVLKPAGALYLADFARLKSLKSVKFFVSMNAQHQPPLFSLDYEQSMRAAFLKEEFDALVVKYFPPGVKLFSTFKVPFLIIIKTADQTLPAFQRQKIVAMHRALKPRYRRDLNDLRTFFALGGLRNDPFRSSDRKRPPL